MNFALWRKTFREVRWLLLGLSLLGFAFHWLRVWITSQIPTKNLEQMLLLIPPAFEKLLPVPISQIASPAGRIAPAYDDPIVLLLMTVWAISRGSDAVSGELNRGTMEMVLAQPVTRRSVLWTQAAMTLWGAAVLATMCWLGTCFGLATIKLERTPSTLVFLPAALNLFSLGALLAGVTTMVLSMSNYRSRTIGAVGAFYAISMILKAVGRLVDNYTWMTYLSFFTPFEPQQLVADRDRGFALWLARDDGSWVLGGLGYDAILIGCGLACYVVATIVFDKRDIPAPL